MEGFFIRLHHFFKNQSQFVHILLAVFSFLLTFLIFFYVYIADTNTKNVTRQYYDSQENYLQQSIQGLYSDLNSAFLLANNTLYDSNVIQSAINPKAMDYTDSLNLVNVLSDTAEHNQLISFISYYVSTTDRVYESNKSVTSLETCSMHPVWQNYLEQGASYRSFTEHLQTDFLYLDNDLYLVQGFQRNLDNSIAYLMVALNRSIFPENLSNSEISVYNNSGRLLYGNGAASSCCGPPAKAVPDTFYHLESDASSHMTLYYQDSRTGWIFYYPIAAPVASSLFAASQNLLLIFLAVLLIGFFSSLILSTFMYRPIRKLVRDTEQQFGDSYAASDAKNEFAYLRSTYTEIVNHQEEMVTLFPVIYNSVTEKIFYDLFFDETTPSVDLTKRLDLLSRKFKFYQRYTVLLAVPSGVVSPDFDAATQQLSQRISDIQNVSEKLFVFPKNGLGCIVILGFNAEVSVAQIKESLLTLCHLILKTSQDNESVSFGMGGICSNITDVRSSLEDAKVNLDFNQYASSLNPSAAQTDFSLHHADRKNILREMRRICDILRTAPEAELQQDTKNILERVQLSGLDLEHKKIICGFFLNLLLEKITALNLDLNGRKDEVYSGLLEITEEAGLFRYMQLRSEELIHEISQFYCAPHYKYIQLVLDYISNNFSDPSLSLETASSYIGINSAYLSRIFKSLLNQNFLHYVNSYRINHAKNLLKNTDLPIQEIGTIVGYTNMTTFFRVFKKYTGTTPKTFRQENLS